jgi:hypothetical protein
MPPTVQAVIHLYGPRNLIEAKCVIPAHLVGDFDELLEEARTVYPAYPPEALVRYIWARGLAAFRTATYSATIPDPNREPQIRSIRDS